MNLCQYKDVFGEPETGLHSYRIFGIAAFDLILTIILAWLISKRLRKHFLAVFALLLVIAEALHLLFCVSTPVTRLISN